MINAADFVNSKNIISLAKKNFKPKKNSLISLVRIACHHNEVEKVLPLVGWLKKNGYKVGINIMQIPELSLKNIKDVVSLIKKVKVVDILYFADSLGSLDAKKTNKIIKNIRLFWKGPMGIHTHDNMGKALENSIAATKNSIEWIDSTVTGMGRGPGNTKTEYAILEFQNKKPNNEKLVSLLKLIENYFEPLKQKYKWGSNPFYFAGLHSIHPSFVQEMLATNSFDTEDIYSNLNYLSTVGGKKYSKELISLGKNFYRAINKGAATKKVIKNKDILILGPGKSIKDNRNLIIKFIKKYKPIVLVLNANDLIPKKYVYAHIVCHPLRLLSDIRKYEKLNQNLITPYSSFSKNIRSKINAKNILNFGLQVKNKKFKFEKYVVLPNSLAISYALGISTSGDAKNIYLAGLDGYSDSSPKKFEIDDLFQNYKLEDNSKNIISLTKTNYKLKI